MINAVILTGSPGVGKTTIIQKLAKDLCKSSEFSGFYTQELRDQTGKRIGFDILTFDGKREILARHLDVTKQKSTHKIGQYYVYLNEFEKICRLIFSSDRKNLLIIDEIGSMELLSNLFQNYMKNLISGIKSKKQNIIATVPLVNRRNSEIINDLKILPNGILFTITKSNRNGIYTEILDNCLNLK